MNDKVALIHSKYQLAVFESLVKSTKEVGFIKIYPNSLAWAEQEPGKAIRLKTSEHKLGFTSGRRLIDEIREVIESNVKSPRYDLWLASDDSAIGQILMNGTGRCAGVNLFEDGLGSYVAHGFLDIALGARRLLRKIKYICLLFPHYRNFWGMGSASASITFGFASHAFPRQNLPARVIEVGALRDALTPFDSSANKEDGFQFKKEDVLFLDQPLLENKIISEIEYALMISRYVEQRRCQNQTRYVIKKHPVTGDENFAKVVHAFRATSAGDVIVITDARNIESIIHGSKAQPSEVVAVCSTALYIIKLLNPSVYAACITTKAMTARVKPMQRYITALERFGVKHLRL